MRFVGSELAPRITNSGESYTAVVPEQRRRGYVRGGSWGALLENSAA